MTIASMQGTARLIAEASTVTLSERSCTMIRYARASSRETGSTHQEAHTLPADDYYSWHQIADLLCRSVPFRKLWNYSLATPNPLAPSLEEYQWKPVPIHPSTSERPFFAILVPTRFATASPATYQSHFSALAPNRHVAMFPNLSGASTLISPAPPSTGAEFWAFSRLLWHRLTRAGRRVLAADWNAGIKSPAKRSERVVQYSRSRSSLLAARPLR